MTESEFRKCYIDPLLLACEVRGYALHVLVVEPSRRGGMLTKKRTLTVAHIGRGGELETMLKDVLGEARL